MPPFLHIGYPKTGTTWLQQSILSYHPDIQHLSERPWGDREWIREITYIHEFDFDIERFRSRYDRVATDNKKATVISFEQFVGDPYAGGQNAKTNADRLKAIFPDATILITIRHQISAIESLYKSYIQEGGAGSLERFLEARYPPNRLYVSKDYFKYDRVVGYYQELFGEDAVVVLVFEELKKAKEQFLAKFFAPMGVDLPAHDVINSASDANRSLSSISLLIARFANRFLYSPFNTTPVIPRSKYTKTGKLRRLLQRRLDPLILHRISPRMKYIQPALQNELIEYYRESNHKLLKLVDIPLSDYDYPL